jgi:nucleoside-diphosphate-sugar epimerase
MLATLLQDFRGCVFVTLPPAGLPRAAAGAVMLRLSAILQTVAITRIVVASSTAVYSAADPVQVDSPIASADPRAATLLDIEAALRATAHEVCIVRLAGLYGPSRIIGREQLVRGEALPGTGSEWLNLVHVEDAARALVAAAYAPHAPRYALITDGVPVQRAAYYARLAALLGAAAPRYDGSPRRARTSRRCDPLPSWQALGVTPRYPSVLQTLEELVRADAT